MDADTITTNEAPVEHETRLIAALAELGYRVEALREEPEWRAWLASCSRFHRYSFGNQLLIAFQNPNASRVAGYRAWQQMGRQVRKGEKGITIIRPRLGRKDAESGDRPVLGFGTAKVFDVAQTDGEPLAPRPHWPMATGDPLLTFERLVERVEVATDVRVTRPENVMDGNPHARGWYLPDTKTIVIRPEIVPESLVQQFMADGVRDYWVDTATAEIWDGEVIIVEPAQQVKTLLHELGHHFDPDLEVAVAGDRASAELVAESVSWVIGTELGLDIDDEVAHYLASWQATPEQLVWVGRRVAAAVRSIEEMVTTELAPFLEEAA